MTKPRNHRNQPRRSTSSSQGKGNNPPPARTSARPRSGLSIDAAHEIVYGKHSVRAVFLARPESIKRLVMREGAAKYLNEFIEMAAKIGINAELMRSGEFLREGGLQEDDKHQGIFLVAEKLRLFDEYDIPILAESRAVLILDQVSNPQNLGNIIRTAAFFDLDAIIYPKDRAADITPTVNRVAVGGIEFVRLFRVTNLARSIEQLKLHGFWIYGFDQRGSKTLAQTQFDEKSAFVIGAEGEGIRHRTKSLCDELVRIPGGREGVESLNAAIAASIVMAEMVR